MTIWVVMGTTGEYSDRNEWPVVAFVDKGKAEARIIACTEEANRIEASRQRRYKINENEKNKFDPKMQMDYTGTSYFHYEVEVEQ